MLPYFHADKRVQLRAQGRSVLSCLHADNNNNKKALASRVMSVAGFNLKTRLNVKKKKRENQRAFKSIPSTWVQYVVTAYYLDFNKQ